MALDAPRRESSRRVELALGALLVATFTVFAAFAVPRLTNNAFGDHEFSGWSGAVGDEIARGRIPYVDFVLPIPPGSLIVLSWMQKLSGRLLLLDELRLIAFCHLAMSGLAYVLARQFTSRHSAWLVAFASLVTLLRGPKECAYDHTAELVAWGSIVLGALALGAESERRRFLAWFGCGALATFTLAFKQSTGSGTVLGWVAAFGYLGLVAFRPGARVVLGRSMIAWLVGCVLGVVALWSLLLAYKSSLGAYWQAVFRDGSTLKGGSFSLAGNLVRYLLGEAAFPASLVATALVSVVLVRILTRPGALSLPESRDADPSITPRAAIALGVPVVVVFGGALTLLATHVRALPHTLHAIAEKLGFVPGFGLLFACVYVGAQFFDRSRSEAERDREHALNAISLAALVTSLLHNLSAPEFRPFYDPNPLIPVAFVFLFGAFDRAGLPRAKLAMFALALCQLFSPKLDRALSAQLSVGREGYWAGMRANEDAVPLVRASQRIRELARSDETVLILPEDLEFRALVGRPRPDIQGAVVFVDQYAARLADGDLARLERDLPKVVVVRPSDRKFWLLFFAVWTTRSGAQRVTERFLDDWLPTRYIKDSTIPTRFDSREEDRLMVNLEIWVRR